MSEAPHDPRIVAEAATLSAELLRNIELQEASLSDCALKAARVARLLGDQEQQRIFMFEASGYPSNPDGMPREQYQLAVKAGRELLQKDSKTNEVSRHVYIESISSLEANIKITEAALSAAKDPDVSISSANPRQMVFNPTGNTWERNTIRNQYSQAVTRLAQRRAFIYSYANETYYRLRFSNITDDLFIRNRAAVDASIGTVVPEAVQQFVSVHDNLASTNPEDWANAVHSCRRILQALADALFPATKPQERGGRIRQLGPDHYINRLMAFVEDHSGSNTFSGVVGSQLAFMGDRLDAIFTAAQKGSHSTVTRRRSRALCDLHVPIGR